METSLWIERPRKRSHQIEQIELTLENFCLKILFPRKWKKASRSRLTIAPKVYLDIPVHITIVYLRGTEGPSL